jgi:very-short-patch-repair endonuclease/DNA modification methylase
MVELIWDGKYDADGKRTAPPRLKLPFQTVETVNESAQQRQFSFEAMLSGQPGEWRNRLIWGDKKYVLPALLDEFAGQVDLIYIDPPFNVGADFSFTATIPDDPDSEETEARQFYKSPTMVEVKAYRDTWGRGLDGYLQWFYETVSLLYELLSDKGTIFVHLDYHVSYYAKAVLDEIFGSDRFINETVWKRQTAKSDVGQGSQHMGRIHESIFLYTKSEKYTWNMQYTEYDQSYVDAFYRYTDPKGRRYRLSDITAPGKAGKGNPYYEFLGVTRYWRFSEKRMQELYEQGRIVQTAPGRVPAQKRYLDEMPGVPLQDLWLDILPVQSQSGEMVDYSTQKPEKLLERIINLSSNPGDLVLDCFCLRAGSMVRVVAPPNPPVNGGEQEKSPRLRGDLGGPNLRGDLGRYLPIEQVLPGHWVIGHDGQAHPVVQIHQREYRGQMIGLQRQGNGNILWLTGDHRVLRQKRPIRFPRQPDAANGWSHVSPEMFARSQELRQNSTSTEQKLWQALRGNQLGVSFRRQHPLGPYIADFYSHQARLVIEVDGSTHTTPQAQANDVQRTAWIEQCGLRVMRFWNNEITENLPGVLQTIHTQLEQTTIPGHPDKEWRKAAELKPGDIIFHGDTLEPVEITRLSTQDTTETVYDLTVADTHSFLTEVCLVHNCGSGTTAAVAEKLGRRWITCDLGRFAIHTARKRLLSIDNVRPFEVQNLGKYERQAWQAAEFGGPQQATQVMGAYRRFILELYHARPITGYAWLHGLKAGRMVHVGAVDSPISPADVKQIALEFHKATGTGADAPSESAVDVLGWDFAFELNEVAKQQAAQANIAMRFVRIPREVLEKKAVEQGDIKFFELAALSVDVAQAGRGVNLTLTDFVIPPDDVPAEVQAAITNWSQWIDYWAVDWDNQGDTFHNQWQTYRTRQAKTLGLKAGHKYDQPGQYTIMVKVIDILGNDTTKTLRVAVK